MATINQNINEYMSQVSSHLHDAESTLKSAEEERERVQSKIEALRQNKPTKDDGRLAKISHRANLIRLAMKKRKLSKSIKFYREEVKSLSQFEVSVEKQETQEKKAGVIKNREIRMAKENLKTNNMNTIVSTAILELILLGAVVQFYKTGHALLSIPVFIIAIGYAVWTTNIILQRRKDLTEKMIALRNLGTDEAPDDEDLD